MEGKKAFVSGSTAGIGLAIAKALGEEGAHVVVNGRTEERVHKAVAEIAEAKPQGKVEGIAADLGAVAGAQKLIDQLPQVDILINSLSIFVIKVFADIRDGDWLRFFQANVLSRVRLSRQYLPGMLRKNWGRIIFISSESVVQIPVEMIHYGMTKTAQLAPARGLAESVAGTGVTVNSALPGRHVRKASVGSSRVWRSSGALLPSRWRMNSSRRRVVIAAETIRHRGRSRGRVTYVASTQSSATNGAAWRGDGGVVRSIV